MWNARLSVDNDTDKTASKSESGNYPIRYCYSDFDLKFVPDQSSKAVAPIKTSSRRDLADEVSSDVLFP